METSYVTLDGSRLTIETLVAISRGDKHITLSDDAKERIQCARAVIDQKLSENKVIYGVTTGFGKLANTLISHDELNELQVNIIRSHSIGFGSYVPDDIILGAMVIEVNSFCKGASGIKLPTVELLVQLINNRVIPLVPSIGSLGASGDLAPLSYIASVLIGEGKVKHKGQILSGKEVLDKLGAEPIILAPKEGLALVNGTHVLTSYAAHTVFDSFNVFNNASLALALTLEAFRGNITAFDSFVSDVRTHQGIKDFTRSIRFLIEGSQISANSPKRLQDPYSFRCAPQVHGAILDAIRHCRKIVETELNSVTDNPLVNVDGNVTISAGNFHGEPIGLVMDYLSIALTELGTISERRVNQLLNSSLSGLPAFLVKKPGLNSGLMIVQYSDAAISSENKILAAPASIDNTPVSADQEDHVSMGLTASKKAYKICANISQMIAIEIYTACQALEFKDENNPSPVLSEVFSYIRQHVPALESDRRYDDDVYWVIAQVNSGDLLRVVERKIGPLLGE